VRIGVVSDVHSNSVALAAVLRALDKEQVETILCAGDIVSYYPFVNEAIDLLRERSVICIAGNHDSYLLGTLPVSHENWHAYNLDYTKHIIRIDNLKWLASLPRERYGKFGGLRWHICHGSPWAIDEYIYPDHKAFARFAHLEADIVVMGHTHIPYIHRMANILLVNPGSCGQPRDYNPMASYAVVDTESATAMLRRVSYDVNAVCRRVAFEGFDSKFIEILKRTKQEETLQVSS
jgi:putative phosphoesterase